MLLVSYRPIALTGYLALVMHFLHAGQERATLRCMEEPMTTPEVITALVYHVDTPLRTGPKHPAARQRGGHVGAAPGPPRGRQPRLVSLVAAGLSWGVSPAPRADAALSPLQHLQHPSGLDAGFLGHSHRPRRHRHVE